MKTLLLGVAAASALALAAPAVAHDHDDDDWDVDVGSYAQFNQEYQHIWQGIEHSLSDGSYSRGQAMLYFRELQKIRVVAAWQERSGQYDPEEIEDRLEQLHERMHIAHVRGHERQDYYGAGSRYGYGQQDPNGYYGLRW